MWYNIDIMIGVIMMNHKYINKETFELVNNIFEVDEDIAQTVSILNKKGYYTKYCCSGHTKDPRLYELCNVKNNDDFEYKTLGYMVNQEKDNYDIIMPYIYTSVYIMFKNNYNFDNLPEGFKKVSNDNVVDYVISKEIYYYENDKRKDWNTIDKEIKNANDKLLKWAISLSNNK